MRKWTLLVIPQGQGNTSTLHVYGFQIWTVVLVLALLSFCSAFFFKRHQISQHEIQRLEQHALELQAAQSEPAPAGNGNGEASNPGLGEEELAELGRRIRAEYEARDEAITAELTALYDLERQVREIHGLPPRTSTAAPPPSSNGNGGNGNGRGGGPSVLSGVPPDADELMARPASLIYGMARPSADIMVQEINLRSESLLDLVMSMEEMQDEVARTPSIWPTNHGQARISSEFGYRQDPFNRSVRHHDGVDFAAPPGTNVLATGRGVVVTAEYDTYLGNVVKLDHGDGKQTWYGHMQEYTVTVGQEVNRGQVIGKVGSTGRSTGPHIHYEVRINGEPVDPAKYLGN